MATIITNPFIKIRNAKDIAGKQYNSFSWYQSKIKQLGGVAKDPTKLMMETPSRQFYNTVEVGNMYLFKYDAKHKETLPYWDMFPLIIPFVNNGTDMKGFNLHYLPYGPRFKILNELNKIKEDKFLTAKSKLQYSYQLLKTSSKFEILQPCVKMYLPQHIRSQFMKIHPKDWEMAVMLPVDRFQKATKAKVWKDSMMSIK